MTMLFPRSSKIKVTGWTLICHDMSLSEMAIRLDTIVQCIKSCQHFVRATLNRRLTRASKRVPAPKSKGNDKPKRRNSSSDSNMLRGDRTTLEDTLERITLFHPAEPNHKSIVSINKLRAQRICSAAAAITFLRLRELYSVTDKLAIVANMCGYPVRLNTIKVGETQEHLGVCMIALSLINGDFSLITPELYRLPKGAVDGEPCTIHIDLH